MPRVEGRNRVGDPCQQPDPVATAGFTAGDSAVADHWHDGRAVGGARPDPSEVDPASLDETASIAMPMHRLASDVPVMIVVVGRNATIWYLLMATLDNGVAKLWMSAFCGS